MIEQELEQVPSKYLSDIHPVHKYNLYLYFITIQLLKKEVFLTVLGFSFGYHQHYKLSHYCPPPHGISYRSKFKGRSVKLTFTSFVLILLLVLPVLINPQWFIPINLMVMKWIHKVARKHRTSALLLVSITLLLISNILTWLLLLLGFSLGISALHFSSSYNTCSSSSNSFSSSLTSSFIYISIA